MLAVIASEYEGRRLVGRRWNSAHSGMESQPPGSGSEAQQRRMFQGRCASNRKSRRVIRLRRMAEIEQEQAERAYQSDSEDRTNKLFTKRKAERQRWRRKLDEHQMDVSKGINGVGRDGEATNSSAQVNRLYSLI
jgi:hypothetical protein